MATVGGAQGPLEAGERWKRKRQKWSEKKEKKELI